MTKTIVLSLSGTGYPATADPITADFHSHLDSSRYAPRMVPYPSAFGGTSISYEVSRTAGIKALYAALDALPEGAPVVLSGYSQGAVIAGDVAREIMINNMTQYNVIAVALIADGYRPEGSGVSSEGIPLAPGFGIAGQRTVPNGRYPTFWVAAWGDPITSLPYGNPLRTVADLVGWYSVKSPADALEWGAKMLNAVYEGQFQDWWAPWKWAGWKGAAAFARGYLFDGRHTTDYIRLGYTRALAKRLNELAVDGE